jgi:predicted transcriptional regulator
VAERRIPDFGGVEEMKLAEALVLRADAQKRLEQLKQRLLRNAKVQEGDQPAEDPKLLLEEFEELAGQLTTLIQRINHTTAGSRLGSMSLTDALALRDVLRLRETLYRELAQAGSITQNRLTKSEVKFKSAIPVREIQKLADSLAKEHRDLDAQIQEANWLIQLVE